MVRRIGVLASLAVVAAMFMGVSSAQADDYANGDTLACTFTGLSGTLDPSIPPWLPTPTTGTTGTYNFSGRGNCSGVVGGEVVPPADDPEVGNATITSDGSYEDILCGTGFARDPWTDGDDPTTPEVEDTDDTTIVDPDDPALPIADDIGYEILFAGGNGNLEIGGDNGGHWDGGGTVHITPEAPGNCVTTAVTQFEVAGAFEAEHDDTTPNS